MAELTRGALLAQAEAWLRPSLGGAARREAEYLLGAALGCGRTLLYAFPERPVEAAQARRVSALCRRRGAGEPAAYLLGRRGFWCFELQVDAAVLVPRPETEHLVEAALALIPAQADWTLADLGTGSGAVALALAAERPHCHIVATDRSAPALAVARRNAQTHGLGNLSFHTGDWYAACPGLRTQLIVSNPPYLESADPLLGQAPLRYEPRAALDGGADGLDDLRHLVAGAGAHLLPGGWLLLEHGHTQGPALRALLGDAGFIDIATLPDLAGLDRVSLGRWPASG